MNGLYLEEFMDSSPGIFSGWLPIEHTHAILYILWIPGILYKRLLSKCHAGLCNTIGGFCILPMEDEDTTFQLFIHSIDILWICFNLKLKITKFPINGSTWFRKADLLDYFFMNKGTNIFVWFPSFLCLSTKTYYGLVTTYFVNAKHLGCTAIDWQLFKNPFLYFYPMLDLNSYTANDLNDTQTVFNQAYGNYIYIIKR